MRLAERVAVVTGATSEIGTATALLLAAKGAAVAVSGHTPTKLEAVAGKLEKAGARFHAAPLDLSRPEVVEGFFADVATRLGPVDILVNTAAWRVRQPFLETTYADWRRTFEVCVDSYFLCSLAAARQMAPRGWGRIIHYGSISGSVLMVPFTAYTAAKGAVHMLAKAMGGGPGAARHHGERRGARCSGDPVRPRQSDPAPDREAAGTDPGRPPGQPRGLRGGSGASVLA
jgi:NAD(P)-dependent dehydrogenase (short-subunit alcohol dehydrogenase family)